MIPQFRRSSAAGWHPSAFNRAPVVEIMEKEEGGETKEMVGKQGGREGRARENKEVLRNGRS